MSFILDIIFIVLAIGIMVLGYVRGFLHKALSLIGFLAILAVSFAFCTQLAELFKNGDIIYPSIYNKIAGQITSTMEASYGSDYSSATTVDFIAVGLDYPTWVAKIFVSIIGIPAETTGAEIISTIADYLATISLNIICFFIMFVVSYILLIVLKILTSVLRKVFVIKLIDGILGIIFYMSLYLLTLCIFLLILYYMIDATWFSGARDFFAANLQIDGDGFRLIGWIYKTNPILHLFKMLGWA